MSPARWCLRTLRALGPVALINSRDNRAAARPDGGSVYLCCCMACAGPAAVFVVVGGMESMRRACFSIRPSELQAPAQPQQITALTNFTNNFPIHNDTILIALTLPGEAADITKIGQDLLQQHWTRRAASDLCWNPLLRKLLRPLLLKQYHTARLTNSFVCSPTAAASSSLTLLLIHLEHPQHSCQQLTQSLHNPNRPRESGRPQATPDSLRRERLRVGSGEALNP